MSSVTVNSRFVEFIRGILQVNSSCILRREDENGSITCLSGTPDNTTILYGRCYVSGDFKGVLNILSVDKVIKALERIRSSDNTDLIRFVVNENNIEFQSQSTRFKYHLIDDGILSQPPINIQKVVGCEYDVCFHVEPLKLQEMLKLSSFASDSNKVYIKGTEDGIYAELTDKAKPNIDVAEMKVSDTNVVFDEMPINLDFFRCLNFNKDSRIIFSINKKISVIKVDIQSVDYETEGYKLTYITSSLTQ